MRLRLLASLLLLSTLLLAGCSSSTKEGATVAIHGNTYDPSTVTVHAGEHVHFANHDTVEHSITSDNGKFDEELDGGAEGNVEFPDAGTFAFHCRYHSSMRGVVTVT